MPVTSMTKHAASRVPIALLPLAALLMPAVSFATESDAMVRGAAIAERAWERGQGYGDLAADVEMTIITRTGQQATRELRIEILEEPGEASRARTLVEAPRDVAGTALLTHTADNGDVQQWLYLPAASRTRRISSENRSGSFMGSEFSFDDFAAQPPSRYRFEHLRDEACGDATCHVLKRVSTDADAIGHDIVWIDDSRLQVQRVEFFDARGDKTRFLTVDDFEQFTGADGNSYWRARSLRMENARTGAASELRWTEISLDTGLSERDFEVSALSRRR